MPEDDLASGLILASASAARATMLRRAGISFQTEAANINEGEIKDTAQKDGLKVEDCAELLAESKASQLSARYPEAWVIGADQILECDGRWFDKPADLAEAGEQLRALSGRTHRLISAVVVLRGGKRLWNHIDQATLTMRPLSEQFIGDYLSFIGPIALSSVGSYQLEGIGAQLFYRIAGDYFTILGLPLLPLLQYLRDVGLLPV